MNHSNASRSKIPPLTLPSPARGEGFRSLALVLPQGVKVVLG